MFIFSFLSLYSTKFMSPNIRLLVRLKRLANCLMHRFLLQKYFVVCVSMAAVLCINSTKSLSLNESFCRCETQRQKRSVSIKRENMEGVEKCD
jgi:hypothetical protein